MNDIVLRVENLSKQYRLGLVGTGTLSHDLNRWWYRVRGKKDPYLMIGESNDRVSIGESEYVWALKDINIEVKQGEVVGVIGRNGAGKSTLLKILSKVTGPTRGRIKAKGRIASLLEVGTGFHPELTGRENIYLNGALLGMTKKEIKRKLDEIIDFAGVQRYVDTPVKRYSSGMRVRLGFAIAAFLEPEILIVDEVLAVGDLAFQQKAIGKMKNISECEGRTVLFVSHNMNSIKNLCSRTILLNNGEIYKEGDTDNIIRHYVENSFTELNTSTALDDKKLRRGNGCVRFSKISLKDEQGKEKNEFLQRSTIVFECEVQVFTIPDELYVNIAFRSGTTRSIITAIPKQKIDLARCTKGNKIFFSFKIRNNPFRIGVYELYYWLGSGYKQAYDVVDNLTKPLIINPTSGQDSLSVGYFDLNLEDISFSHI